MTSPSFLCSYVGFDGNNAPILDIETADDISRRSLLGETFAWTIDRSVRYCAGWVDLTVHQAHVCPDHAVVGAPTNSVSPVATELALTQRFTMQKQCLSNSR